MVKGHKILGGQVDSGVIISTESFCVVTDNERVRFSELTEL